MNTTTRILFMGTPAFALPTLRMLHESGPANGWEVISVVTQPDRKTGRGKKVIAGAVKTYAAKQNIPVLQPASLRKDPAAVDALRALAADLFVVAAYGLILPPAVLALPAFGAINIHASILPAYRGASPIATALLDGCEETGVSIMLMDEGMDTGPVLTQVREPIAPDATTATLSARLGEAGATALRQTIPGWLAGDVAPVDQTELPGEASICRLIKKSDGLIDWSDPAARIERMTRAYAPWPSAFTRWRGEPFKILSAAVVAGRAKPGRVVATQAGAAVGTGRDLLLLRTVQPAGKRPMDVASLVNGAPAFLEARLGEE